MANTKTYVTQCPGSDKVALSSDLITVATHSRARCADCGATVAVWFANEQWYRCGHQAGVDADEEELARLVVERGRNRS
jgi:hypothetical protein